MPHHHPRAGRRARLAAIAAAVLAVAGGVVVAAAPADAAACSTTSQSSCQITTQATVTGGTLGVSAPGALYWGFTQSGYDQIESASAASGSAVAPIVSVTDATGSAKGWALSAYMSGTSTLPSGTGLTLNGAGTTIGAAQTGAVTNTLLTAACDTGSTCTNASPASAPCAGYSSLGISACPTAGPSLLTGTSATAQVNLYTAAAASGLGAICLGTGTVTGTGCVGTKSFFNLSLKSGAAAGTYTAGTINLTATSGP